MRLAANQIRLWATMIALSAGVHAQQPEHEARTALVVGVESYHDRYFSALGAPVSDARALQAKLRALGFEAAVLLNPNRHQLTDAVDNFGAALARRGGIGLFYFSGHGTMKSDESGTNYLIPAGTNIRTENDLPEEAFNAQRVANRMKEAKNRLNLVFLDACRSHDLPRGDGAKAGGGGLAAMRGASGLMFFFATQPGEIAIEDASKSSLFTAALLRHLDSPGLSFMDMMGDVTAETEETSQKLSDRTIRQSPFIAGTFSGRFYFNPATLTTNPETPKLPSIPTEPPPRPPRNSPATEPAPVGTNTAPFVNSLGMKFVPVTGARVSFSIWETRVQDYEKFVQATKRVWGRPPFTQGPTHPAVRISYIDATDFCAWLTEMEHHSGALPPRARYRLPTDDEWSRAVGLGEEYGDTPKMKDCVAPGYPWGQNWPPPKGAGNYDQSLHVDSFPFTSPVGSFKPNKFGIYDLGGNAYEWVADFYDETHTMRTTRGASWADEIDQVMSSNRNATKPEERNKSLGFRCVLDRGAP